MSKHPYFFPIIFGEMEQTWAVSDSLSIHKPLKDGELGWKSPAREKWCFTDHQPVSEVTTFDLSLPFSLSLPLPLPLPPFSPSLVPSLLCCPSVCLSLCHARFPSSFLYPLFCLSFMTSFPPLVNLKGFSETRFIVFPVVRTAL